MAAIPDAVVLAHRHNLVVQVQGVFGRDVEAVAGLSSLSDGEDHDAGSVAHVHVPVVEKEQTGLEAQ